MLILKPYFDSGAGDGGGADPQIDETQKAEIAEYETFLDKGEDKLTDEEKVKYTTYKEKYATEELDPITNKPITPERKQELADIAVKVKSIQDKKEEARTKEENDFITKHTVVTKQDIYKEAEEISGFKIETDYGTAKPNTPEWVAKRETALFENAQKQYDAELQQRHPVAYRLMKFMERGGKAEDFLKPENKDFSSIKLSKTDLNTAENVYRDALATKGIKPDHIEILVTNAKDKGKLYEEANSELEAIQVVQKRQADREEEEQQRAEEDQAKVVKTFVDSLSAGIEKGINGNTIPIPDRAKFYNFIADHVVPQANGKFIIVREIDPKSLDKDLALEYWRYKGGNLTDLITKKAESLKANEIRDRVIRRIVPKGSSTSQTKFISLQDI